MINKWIRLKDGRRLDVEKTDFHVHTFFSSDAIDVPELSPEYLAKKAIEKGLSALVLTDHLDVNSEIEGLYAPFEAEKRNTAVRAVQKQYEGRLEIVCGIELGQPTQYPRAATEMLAAGKYDFVLGSLHNLEGLPDFALIDPASYDEAGRERLLSRYLEEYLALTDFPEIDSFAHLNYPLRYFVKAGFSADFMKYEEKVRQILRKIIARGAALEINTSGYRSGMGAPMPDFSVLSLYRALGGTKITLGSDAHRTQDVGADFEKALALADAAGL